MKTRIWTHLAAALFFTGVMLINMLGSAPVSASPAKPVPRPAVASRSISTVLNRHLHGASAAVEKASEKFKEKKKGLARHWRGRWEFVSWAEMHRGTGTIEGQIRGASGAPMSGAKAFLRNARGKALSSTAAKHITHSGAGGVFIMHHVRIGSYRVRAEHGKASGHTAVHVHSGGTAVVNVKV